jgi:hypothetical protein
MEFEAVTIGDRRPGGRGRPGADDLDFRWVHDQVPVVGCTSRLCNQRARRPPTSASGRGPRALVPASQESADQWPGSAVAPKRLLLRVNPGITAWRARWLNCHTGVDVWRPDRRVAAGVRGRLDNAARRHRVRSPVGRPRGTIRRLPRGRSRGRRLRGRDLGERRPEASTQQADDTNY